MSLCWICSANVNLSQGDAYMERSEHNTTNRDPGRPVSHKTRKTRLAGRASLGAIESHCYAWLMVQGGRLHRKQSTAPDDMSIMDTRRLDHYMAQSKVSGQRGGPLVARVDHRWPIIIASVVSGCRRLCRRKSGALHRATLKVTESGLGSLCSLGSAPCSTSGLCSSPTDLTGDSECPTLWQIHSR